jgi:hypothetical protein
MNTNEWRSYKRTMDDKEVSAQTKTQICLEMMFQATTFYSYLKKGGV